MTIKDKILVYLDYKGIKKTDFFEHIGISPSSFMGEEKKNKLGSDKIIKVLTTYPDLSSDWLLLDKGDMLVTDGGESDHTCMTKPTNIHDRIAMLVNIYGDGKNTLFANMIGCSEGSIRGYMKANLPKQDILESIVKKCDNLSAEWLLTGEGEMQKGDSKVIIDTPTTTNKATTQEIPLIPYTAPIGFLSKLLEGATQLDCEMIPSPIKDAQIAIQVMGESMLPEYMGGDILLLRKVDERIFIEWGMCYILDTHNGVVLKRVMPGKTKDTITCESYNDKYPPFEVKLSDIIGFYKVVMTLRKKTI